MSKKQPDPKVGDNVEVVSNTPTHYFQKGDKGTVTHVEYIDGEFSGIFVKVNTLEQLLLRGDFKVIE